ncbi:DNA polymerase [Striga asiatica]|uniref:DNA polymerase epsilon catalytic subunit n=1 Tax=Striga asiatica TaxID=4170 RepID=A0A5A7QLV0_STRAF|nr:DNA polymerase [Striga asiatica]
MAGVKEEKVERDSGEKECQRLDNFRTSNDGSEAPSRILNFKQAQGRVGVNSYFQRHELTVTCCHWQIIQFVPSSMHGQFFAWVVVDGTMRTIPIQVSRLFYLNPKAPVTEEFPGRRANKILPHGHKKYNLIEVTIDEDQFRAESEKLAAHLADPEVEWISLPKKRNVQDGWSLDELHMKTTTECSYLENSMSFFYLYHSISDSRAMYVAYFPTSSQVYVVVVSPFPSKELSPQMLERQFREASQALSIQLSMTNEGMTFKVEYVAHVKDAQGNLQRMITEYRLLCLFFIIPLSISSEYFNLCSLKSDFVSFNTYW